MDVYVESVIWGDTEFVLKQSVVELDHSLMLRSFSLVMIQAIVIVQDLNRFADLCKISRTDCSIMMKLQPLSSLHLGLHMAAKSSLSRALFRCLM